MKEPTIRKPIKIASVLRVLIYAGMVSGIISILLVNAGIPVVLHVLISLSIFGLAFLLLFKGNKKAAEPTRVNEIAIVKEVEELPFVKETAPDMPETIQIVVSNTNPSYTSIKEMLGSKVNRNIAIIGLAGSGKTTMIYYILQEMKDLKKIIFQYKKTDRYAELGIPSMNLTDFVPNVFQDKDAFLQAWKVSAPADTTGITLLRSQDILGDIVKRSNNWEEFAKIVEQEIAKEKKASIRLEALSFIKDKMKTLYRENMTEYELPDNLVLDFSDLHEEQAFVFYCEYELRQLYREITSGKRKGTMIMVDEGNLIAQNKGTILPDIAERIRSTGALMIATQRYSTISGDVAGNCAVKICFEQSEKEDLDRIKAISPLMEVAMRALEMHEFIELGQSGKGKTAYIFKLSRPIVEFQPIKEWRPEVVPKTKQQRNYYEEIEEMMSSAQNIQKIARKLAEREGDAESIKRDILPVLRKMVANGDLSVIQFENIRMGKDGIQTFKEKPYYKAGTEQFHEYMVKSIADILYLNGINFKIEPTGRSIADITGEDFVIEAETGSKRRTNDLKQRMERYKNEGRFAYIIVPNAEVQKMYPNSFTIPEFAEMIEKTILANSKEEVKQSE